MKAAHLAGIAMLATAALAAPVQGADGKAVYEGHCAACHQADGNGGVGLAPPLAGTIGARMATPTGRRYLSGIVVTGLAGKLESRGVTYNGIMPSWAALSDDELASVLNYVLTAFNAEQLPQGMQPLTAEELAAARSPKPTAKDLKAWRAESEAAK